MRFTIKILGLSCLLLLVSFLLLKEYNRSSQQLYQFSCDGFLSQFNDENDYAFFAGFRVSLSPDGEGLISIDGDFEKNHKKYLLRRDLTFRYRPYSQYLYRLTDLEITRGERDTLPDNVLSMNFQYMYMASVPGKDNAILIGTVKFPAFICLTK